MFLVPWLSFHFVIMLFNNGYAAEDRVGWSSSSLLCFLVPAMIYPPSSLHVQISHIFQSRISPASLVQIRELARALDSYCPAPFLLPVSQVT